MFDSHCHLDAREYDADRREVIARARTAGVTGILVPGYAPSAWAALKALCALDPMLSCGVGIHPWYVHEIPENERERALSGLAETACALQAAAIGECGLDAKRAKSGGAELSAQERVLAVQLRVARELDLPVILHCVGAHARLLSLLGRDGPLPAGGVLHSYSGSRELIRDYARLNLSFSFAGIVTHDNALRPREALKAVPIERLLVESDGPDQAAHGVTSKRAEPAHVALVLGAAAQIRDQPFELLAARTSENARRLFARVCA